MVALQKPIVASRLANAEERRLEDVKPRPIKKDEVLVRIVASGICLANVHFGSVVVDEAAGQTGIAFPIILGHEGEPEASNPLSMYALCTDLTSPLPTDEHHLLH